MLSRWDKFDWANNHIVVRLLDLLKDNKDFSDPKVKDIMRWVVDTIGEISRIYPMTAREHLLTIFEPLTSLIGQKDIDAQLEKSCLKAIIWTGHHLQVQVSKFLTAWKPKFIKADDESLDTLVANFVGTRAKRFSYKTVTITKKAAIRKESMKSRNNFKQ